MTGPIFDHDKLDGYRLALEYITKSFGIAKELGGLHRQARLMTTSITSTSTAALSTSNGTGPFPGKRRQLVVQARING